jgi:hypothetical protein
MAPPPSAPPCDEEDCSIPVVTATAVNASVAPVARIVTTTYDDGRQVTVTEFQQPGTSTTVGTAPAAAAAAGAKFCERGILRRDLGARPAVIICGHCNHTGKTKTICSLGSCTFISIFLLILCCLPFFWIPLVCPSVSVSNFIIFVWNRRSLTRSIHCLRNHYYGRVLV